MPSARIPLAALAPASGSVFSVSADGHHVASLEENRQVVVIEEPLTGRAFRRLSRARHGYRGVALSDDGRLVATAPDDVEERPLTLAVFESETGRMLVDGLESPARGVLSQLKFGPLGRSLWARANQGPMIHHALDTRKTWKSDIEPKDRGNCDGEFTLLPVGRLLAWDYWGSQTGKRPLRIYDQTSGALRATFPGRSEGSDNVVGFPDGQSLVFRSGVQAVVWHFEQSIAPQPAGHTDEAWTVAYSSDGRFLATGSDDTDDLQTLRIWDAASGQLLRGWKAHEATTSAIAFQPGGSLIASAALLSKDNLRLWDAATGTLLATLEGHSDTVRTVAFSPDGRLLASADSAGTIRVWNVAARACLRTLSGHSDTIRQIAFSPDGSTLASVGNDSTVRLWNVDRLELVWTWRKGVKIAAVAFLLDGRTLAWAHQDGVVQRWDLTHAQLLPPLHTGYDELRCLAISPDGRTLAAAGKSGDVHLWHPGSGQELLTLDGRPCQVNALSFSPDGRSLAACWHDGTVRLFRAR